MRVTNSMMSNAVTGYLMRQSEDLYKVREQISSQKKINRPSHDPTGMRNILEYRNKIATVDQYLDNPSSNPLEDLFKAYYSVSDVRTNCGFRGLHDVGYFL